MDLHFHGRFSIPAIKQLYRYTLGRHDAPGTAGTIAAVADFFKIP